MVKFFIEENQQKELVLTAFVDANYIRHYPDRFTEIENVSFDAKVTIVDYYKGRSAIGLTLFVEGHPQVPRFFARMSLADFVYCIQGVTCVEGIFKSRLRFIKKGANCFVVPVGEDA